MTSLCKVRQQKHIQTARDQQLDSTLQLERCAFAHLYVQGELTLGVMGHERHGYYTAVMKCQRSHCAAPANT